ncbi:hypothetical protein CEP54_010367 [Fusarium duplospermum]|uniref:Uncharacterized protein n=1 Tax=Fusarium duplospermum TaxID=1325734 RepID=A0A428PKC7_9HYPO|nr:hypothetical protein CEP54_010367 [Fusarium duplospermum]
MPPSPDPWGPQDPSLPQDAEPSMHANNLDPDDLEASHFLDNLDMSAFEPCDFDFSSLMDLDQIDDAALLETLDFNAADLTGLETSDVQAPATLGPELTQVFDQAWLQDVPGSAESGLPAIEALASFPETSNVTDILLPPLASNNLGQAENCHNWGNGGNTSQFPRDFRKPSPDQIRETEKQLLWEYPSGIALDFLWGLRRPEKFHWVGGISPDAQREIDGHLDRQTRVRTALWIFSSVFVSKLPAFTDFWSHLPEEIDIFKHRTRKSLQKSLADIDTDLLVSLDAIFNQKKKFLNHLFPAEYGYWTPQQETCEQDYTRLLWRRMQSNTPEGIREIEQISACQPAELNEKVRLYEQNEAERAMVPKTREQQWETARRFFGRLLSAMESPIIQNEASFNEPDGSLRPSSLTFLILLSRFTRRIPGRCPNHAKGYTERPAVTKQHVDL